MNCFFGVCFFLKCLRCCVNEGLVDDLDIKTGEGFQLGSERKPSPEKCLTNIYLHADPKDLLHRGVPIHNLFDTIHFQGPHPLFYGKVTHIFQRHVFFDSSSHRF